ncbi:phosphatase [Thermodesulfobacteriota bacterium]
MNLIADLHVHTVASGHAFSTLQENVASAKSKGLEILGVSDHGPCVAGAPSFHYFRTLRFIPRYLEGVMILRGAEANIISADGKIDIPEHCLERLDYTMAGFHSVEEYQDNDIDVNTRAMIKVMDNPYVKIITHPGNPKYPVHYEEVVKAAKEKNVALEINNASFVLTRHGSRKNCTEIARLIAKYDANIIIGSDAHISYDIMTFDAALKVVEDTSIKEENVINSNKERLFEFLELDIK